MQGDNSSLRERVDEVSVFTAFSGVFTLVVILIATLSVNVTEGFTWIIAGTTGAAVGLVINFILVTTFVNIVSSIVKILFKKGKNEEYREKLWEMRVTLAEARSRNLKVQMDAEDLKKRQEEELHTTKKQFEKELRQRDEKWEDLNCRYEVLRGELHLEGK